MDGASCVPTTPVGGIAEVVRPRRCGGSRARHGQSGLWDVAVGDEFPQVKERPSWAWSQHSNGGQVYLTSSRMT